MAGSEEKPFGLIECMVNRCFFKISTAFESTRADGLVPTLATSQESGADFLKIASAILLLQALYLQIKRMDGIGKA